MIVVRHNIDTLDRIGPAVARGRRPASSRRPCAISRSASRSTSRCASSSSSSSTPSSPLPATTQTEGCLMLIIQRPEIEAGEAEGNLQRFTISPLEPGFGHTLGNSLRRTLLSSIPGAAVTQVRFDDALHEFDVIKGVKEDVTDVILNLKDLVLHVHVRRAGHAAPRQARSGRGHRRPTSRRPSDVEILNPDLYIATVNATGRLALDLTVEQGRGYLSAERNKRTTHDRRHPGRRDLLAGAPRVVLDRADARRAGHELRQAHPRDRDRRFDHAARRARVGGRHAAQARRPRRRAVRRAARPRARRGRVADVDVARPRPRRSRSSTCRSGRATASSGRASTRSASSCRRPRTICSRSRTSASKSLEEVIQKLDERGLVAAGEGVDRCRLRRRARASAAAPSHQR